MSTSKQRPILRKDGVTRAERYLKRLCDHTFLSLWSYPGIYRDQYASSKNKGQGKEVCDLLVVFENHIIILSDKDCRFPNTGNLDLDWQRWFRRAVHKSAQQIWGAERWIKSHPDRLFLDRACTVSLPIALPPLENAEFHRIVVAHEASVRCQKELGGSGSLMIISDWIGDDHYLPASNGGRPFAVGQINPNKGYVHILDDTSLNVLLRTLDTITDFTAYLSKKEQLVTSGSPAIFAAGEEELLAFYLSKLNEEGEHDFIIPSNVNGFALSEGFWSDFAQSEERQSQIEADRVSYAWDALVEKFSKHILSGTQYYTNHPGVENQERILRFLAREHRTRRRMLAEAIIGLIEKTPELYRATRVVLPSKPGDPYYFFLLLPRIEGVPYPEYREVRRNLLETYCMVTKLQFPEAKDIIGIATETGLEEDRSEDAVYYDASEWTEEEQAEAREGLRTLEDLGMLGKRTQFSWKEFEYPVLSPHHGKKVTPVSRWPTKYPRNKPCPCGSGKKYKYCCGKKF